jgi:hypothetical protein
MGASGNSGETKSEFGFKYSPARILFVDVMPNRYFAQTQCQKSWHSYQLAFVAEIAWSPT